MSNLSPKITQFVHSLVTPPPMSATDNAASKTNGVYQRANLVTNSSALLFLARELVINSTILLTALSLYTF